MRPNAELVLAQQPDVVLQLEGRSEAQTQTENLRSLGLKVLTFEVNSFERLFEVTETLGRLVGREDKAQALVDGWKSRVQALRSRNAGKPVTRVFYEVRYPNLLAAGRGGISSEILALAGGENVVSDGKKLVRYSEESLIAADPDAYIIQKGPMEILTYQQRIGLVLRHIEQHLDDRPNLEELARIACFSPYHFHRIFSSMTATQEVGGVIRGIQEGTRKSIDGVDKSVATIESATHRASLSGEALTQIVSLVEQASDQVRSIAAASEQQSASSEEISRSVEQVATISAETAQAMESTARVTLRARLHLLVPPQRAQGVNSISLCRNPIHEVSPR